MQSTSSEWLTILDPTSLHFLFFYYSDCVCLKEESLVHIGCLRVSKLLGDFHFGVNL